MAYGILKPAKAYPDTFEEAFDVSKFFMCLGKKLRLLRIQSLYWDTFNMLVW